MKSFIGVTIELRTTVISSSTGHALVKNEEYGIFARDTQVGRRGVLILCQLKLMMALREIITLIYVQCHV